MQSAGTAAGRWAQALAAWAIPPEVLDRAPESPWVQPVALFEAAGDEPATPSRDRALEALGPSGTVLDVGCGGGRAAFALVPPAGRVVGVDRRPPMLAAFAAAARRRGVDHEVVLGAWPDVAAQVPPADVVVCHHVAYDVPALAPFALALTAAARRRVVLELSVRHPLARSAPLWQRFWGITRPDGPTSDDAAAVLREAGLPVRTAVWDDPAPPRELALDPAERVRYTRVRLCLPAERDGEVAAALAESGDGPPRRLVTLWWDAG